MSDSPSDSGSEGNFDLTDEILITESNTSLEGVPGYALGGVAPSFPQTGGTILNDGASPMGQLAATAPSAKSIWPGALTTDGKLFIPNRGVLQVLPGDYIGVDANGGPILVSANAIAGGSSPSASTSWTKSA